MVQRKRRVRKVSGGKPPFLTGKFAELPRCSGDKTGSNSIWFSGEKGTFVIDNNRTSFYTEHALELFGYAGTFAAEIVLNASLTIIAFQQRTLSFSGPLL